MGGCGPLTWALVDENAGENEKIGSHEGVLCWKILYVDPPMQYWIQGGPGGPGPPAPVKTSEKRWPLHQAASFASHRVPPQTNFWIRYCNVFKYLNYASFCSFTAGDQGVPQALRTNFFHFIMHFYQQAVPLKVGAVK